MAKKKRPPNWEDIKTRRVVNGETWDSIREIYDVPLSTLKNRASREKWQEIAVQIGETIREDEISRRKRILAKVGNAFETMIDAILTELPNMGPTVQDGEGFPNKYYHEAYKQGLAAYLKPDAPTLQEEEEPPGFNVTVDA